MLRLTLGLSDSKTVCSWMEYMLRTGAKTRSSLGFREDMGTRLLGDRVEISG